MKTFAIVLATIGLFVASIAGNAGVAPSHDSSQLSQSGAKIAPPSKNAEPAKKDEKEKEQDKGSEALMPRVGSARGISRARRN